MLREKERTIKKLQAEMDCMKNKSKPSKKTLRDIMKWLGEEINFSESVNTFVQVFYFRGTNSSRTDGRTTSPIKRIACHQCACANSHCQRGAKRMIFGRG
jgi:hypothetical protein